MNDNLVSGSLKSEDSAAIKVALNTIREKLPFLRGLDPEARRSLPRGGDKSRAFVRKSLEVAVQNPGMLPRAFDLEEFGRDIALDEALIPIAESIPKLAEMVDDTLTAVRSDAYVAALTVYQSAKLAGKNSGLDGVLDELGRRFARKSGVPVPPATNTAIYDSGPFDHESFAGLSPLALGRPRLLSGFSSSVRGFAPRFLQTVPRGSALAFRFDSCGLVSGGLSPPG